MNPPVFSPRAQSDIEEIYEFTLAHWGREQAERYINYGAA